MSTQHAKKYKRFAPALLDLMQQTSTTQTAIANKIGITRGSVSNWCNHRYLPTLTQLYNLWQMLAPKQPQVFVHLAECIVLDKADHVL